MGQDLFKFLPSEITVNIFSRLRVRSVAISKCVCKSWLDLLETDGFIKSHFAKSVPSLATLTLETESESESESNLLNLFEFEDELLEFESSSYDHRYNPSTKFDFPRKAAIRGSANGLLFLEHLDSHRDDPVYVCNPVTREFIEIHPSQKQQYEDFIQVCHGFGASKIGGKHKVVCIVFARGGEVGPRPFECHVYTIGTGSWRCVEAGESFDYWWFTSPCAFVNGNLHWIVLGLDDSWGVFCFDLETECLSIFCVPPPPLQECPSQFLELFALSGRLCLSDCRSDDEIVFWLMKEYGVEKSWSKEYVITQNPDFDREFSDIVVYPIKVFKNGDMLMLWDAEFLFYYSNKTKTTHRIDMFNTSRGLMDSVLLSPSFLLLKSFEMEDVISI